MNFIFDMDGVLINSEPLHARSRLAVLESMGVSTDMDMSSVIGSSTLAFWENMIIKFGLDASAVNLERIQMALLIEMMKKEKCQPPEGLFSCWMSLKGWALLWQLALLQEGCWWSRCWNTWGLHRDLKRL